MSSTDKWELYEDKKGEWRWRRTASNGNIVGAASEGYTNKSDAIKNAERYGYNGKFDSTGKWEFYQDKAGEYRWRHTANNGNIIGAASEGYSSKAACLANAERHGYKEA